MTNPLPKIFCGTCKTIFKPKRSKTKYCGRPCQYKSQMKADPTYSGIHMWIRSRNSKTGKCVFCGHKGKTQWAKKDGREYTRNIKDYNELCVSCHRKYDMTPEWRRNLSKNLRGRTSPRRWKPVVARKGDQIITFPSVKAAVKGLGFSKSGVFGVLSGRYKSIYGYKITYKV